MEESDILNIFNGQDQKTLKEMLEKRHPDYQSRLPHWEFCEATYKGGPDWFEQNIFKYHKEGDAEFKDRQGRAYRFNHTREVVDIVNKYIFKASIARKVDDAPASIQKFWRDSTLAGRDITHFMRQVAEKSSVFGRPYIVVDSNASGEGTLIEESEAGERVYAYLVKPQNVLDMAFDDLGELVWIMIRETARDDSSPLASGEVRERYRLWTRDYWVLFEIEYNETTQETTVYASEAGVTDLGMVPVIPGDHVVHENRYSSPSLIDDVAYLDRATANYLSNLDAIIQDQTFSQLIMPAQAMLPDDDEESKLLELGTKRIFTYDAQATIAPQYISPDPKQANVILAVINKIIGEIYHSVGMAGERTKQDNAVGIDNSSGVAKAYDFERMNAMLAAKASALQDIENRLVKIVAAWTDTKLDDDTELVKYPANFDVRSLYDEFEIAQRLALVDAPDLVRKEQMKLLVEKLFPRLSKKIIEKMSEEIDDEWPTNPELQVGSLDGQNPPGVTTPPQENEQGQNNDGDKATD